MLTDRGDNSVVSLYSFIASKKPAMANQVSSPSLADFNNLWDYSDPAQSEQKFQSLLPLAESSGDESYLAQLLTQIARAQGLARKYSQAHATLDRAQNLLSDDSHIPRIRYLLERGRVFNDTQRIEEAREMFLAAWELGTTRKIDGYAVDAAHMLGILDPPQQAVQWNLKAIDHASASNDPAARRWLATLNNNLGWSYVKLDQLNLALAAFQEALRLRQEQGNTTNIRIANWCIAKVMRLMGRAHESLQKQEAIRAELQAANEADGYNDEEIGECLLALARTEEARPHFARAHELLSKDPWFPPSEAARLERMKELSRI